METMHSPGRRGAYAGIGSGLALLVAMASLNVPHEVNDQELVDWWSKSANRSGAIISMYAMAAAALLFLGLLAHLRDRVEQSVPTGNQTPRIIQGAGFVYVASLVLSGVARGAVARGVSKGEPLPGVDLLRFLPEVAYTALGVFAMLAATTFIAAATISAFRHGTLPRWLAILGAVVAAVIGVAVVAGVGPFAAPLLIVWLIAASIQLGRTRSTPAATQVDRRVRTSPGIA